MKTHSATITSITPDGVQTTHYRLEKPILIFSRYHPIDLEKRKEYEASKVVSKVENVKQGKQTKSWFFEEINDLHLRQMLVQNIEYEYKRIKKLKLGMSCSIIETGEGKCKIVKFNLK